MPEVHTGKLLVATPAITDPNFFRTVVLVCGHDENGAFGLVLNRPVDDEKVVDHLLQWGEHSSTPAVLFHGGPVETSAAFALGKLEPRPGEEPSVVFGTVALIDLRTLPEEMEVELREVRVFVGYSGWGAGQLETEVEEGGWFVVDPEPGDPFSANPDDLWKDVLSRQSGELRLYSFFPLDPTQN